MAHNYSYMCGCAGCSEIEESRERAAEAAEPYIGALESNWSVLSETMGELTDDELRDLADKLNRCDFAGLGSVLMRKVAGYVHDIVERRMDERGCDVWEAATQLASAYGAVAPAVRKVMAVAA